MTTQVQTHDPIIAFAQERITEIERHPLQTDSDNARICELRSIIAFCGILHHQQEMVEQALANCPGICPEVSEVAA